MSWIKEKFKRFKKWILGIFIPVALAAPLGVLPPEDTTYRIEWKMSMNRINCKNDYQCNKDAFTESLAKYPDAYSGYKEISGETGTYSFVLSKDFNASTTQQALNEAKKEIKLWPSMGLQAKTLLGNFVTKYDYTKVDNAIKGEPITLKEKVFAFFAIKSAYAIDDDFESCSTGDLDGCNGGTGWSEAWGAVTGCLGGDKFTVVSTPVFAGSRAMKWNSVDGGVGSGDCVRAFTAISTNDSTVTWEHRTAQTNAALNWYFRDDADNVVVYGRISHNTNDIYSINNATLDSVGTYVVDTWYTHDIKITSFANKTYQFQLDGGGYSADKTFEGNDASANIENFFTTVASGGEDKFVFFDDFGPVAAAGGEPDDDSDDTWYFNSAFEWLIHRALAK